MIVFTLAALLSNIPTCSLAFHVDTVAPLVVVGISAGAGHEYYVNPFL